ncbi:MAG: TonB-dependent receptor [Flammeovirgaceae bacterium]|jgi:TonB-dependent receptor
MTIPGIDPDRNDVQIDLFPTSILENVVVYKTFSPNLNGDFTGGLVDIETKAFPESKYTTVSFGVSYNPSMNLKSNFLSQEGGNTDFLGFDDGTREIPISGTTQVPDATANDPILTDYTRSFNPNLAAKRKNSFLNHNFSVSHGNQINKENVTFGYNAVLNYRREFRHYDDAENNIFFKDPVRSDTDLAKEISSVGTRSEDETLWSSLLSGSMKFKKNSFTLNLLRIQNATETNIDREVIGRGETTFDQDNDILGFTQRSLTNVSLIGKHGIGERAQLEWANSFSVSNSEDPDYRDTRIDRTDGILSLEQNNAGARRYFRYLDERNNNFRVDFTLPYGEKNKFRAGINSTIKSREFDLFLFFNGYEGSPGDFPNDPNWILQPENVWTVDKKEGSFVDDFSNENNSFEARQTIFAAYVMSELVLTPKLKSVFGVRMEKAQMFYTGLPSKNTDPAYDDTKTLDDLDFLPSVSLVYELKENMNLRGSWTRTLARPSFKEKSQVFIPDPISNIKFNGNIDLEAAKIWNYDVRWEYFFRADEVISVSAFHKEFTNHIVVGASAASNDPTQTIARNVPESKVTGIELEVRKGLGFVNALKNFSVGFNLSLVKSSVDRTKAVVAEQLNPDGLLTQDEVEITEYEDKLANAREGEVIEETRQMIGQSPYLLNTNISYKNDRLGLTSTLSYNVQGETLAIRGVRQVPDIYVKPFNSLNLNFIKTLGEEKKSSITLGISNLLNIIESGLGTDLNTDNELIYRSYGSDDQTFSRLNPGSRISLKYTTTF